MSDRGFKKHFDGRRFYNPDAHQVRGFLDVLLSGSLLCSFHMRGSDMRPRLRFRTGRRFENRTPPVPIKERTLAII